MKTMKIGLMATLVFLSFVFLMGPRCWPPPGEGGKARRVIQAISDLDSMDYVVVRNAIQELNKLMEAPNIKSAVNPLKNVLFNTKGYYDSLTRGMAALTLVKIGVTLGEPKGNNALQFVIQELEHGQTESVRASCAYSLGISGREMAQGPLIATNERDKSPLVREAACSGLMLLSNGKYYSESCRYENEEDGLSMTSADGNPSSAPVSAGTEVSADDLRWLQTHIFMPLDSLISLGEQGSHE